MRWREDKEGIVMDAPNRIATVANMAGDGFLWRSTRWGITNTQAEAMKQAEAAFDENEHLRALLEDSLAIHRDSLESNKISDDEPDCECDACKRFRSIIARIEAVLR
jgi:hypothetical protein